MIIEPQLRQLFQIFPKGWISSDWCFNCGNGAVQIPLNAIVHDSDIPKIVLAAASYEAAFGKPFLNPVRNWFHRNELRKAINHMLGTRFSKTDFEIMGDTLDFNNIELVKDFVLYGYSIAFLKPYVQTESQELATS